MGFNGDSIDIRPFTKFPTFLGKKSKLSNILCLRKIFIPHSNFNVFINKQTSATKVIPVLNIKKRNLLLTELKLILIIYLINLLVAKIELL